MPTVLDIKAREILDSRGKPTVEADVLLDNGGFGRASVPSGASTGKHEALELRDHDLSRFCGLGVQKAIVHINGSIAQALRGKGVTQVDIDTALVTLDGTSDKSKLGANAILAVSLAFARATADANGQPLYRSLRDHSQYLLPLPLMNVLNGGAHANNSIDVQEFMIVPAGAKTFADSLRMGAEVFQTLKHLLSEAGHSTAVGDEGGFAPALSTTDEALGFIMKAIEKSNYQPGRDVYLALDVAASELFKNNQYHIAGENKHLDAEALTRYLSDLATRYPVVSIEDGMAEDDWQGWRMLTEELGDTIQLVGDDLFVTNPTRLQTGIKNKAANAILIKPNQIGTLTETLATIDVAQQGRFNVIISHRSGETEDTFIADLAVAVKAGQIKTGSLARSERTAKYNRLLRIEEELGSSAVFAGRSFVKN